MVNFKLIRRYTEFSRFPFWESLTKSHLVAAQAYCVERGVDSQAKWTVFSRSGDRPRDSPGNSHQTYKAKGRLGYDSWFGKPAAHASRVFLEGFLKYCELRRQTSPVFTRTRAYVRHLLARWMRPLGSPRRADPACMPRPVRASGGHFHSRFTLGSSTVLMLKLSRMPTSKKNDLVFRTHTSD